MLGDFEAYRRGVLGVDTPRNTLLQEFLKEEISQNNDNELTIEDFYRAREFICKYSQNIV